MHPSCTVEMSQAVPAYKLYQALGRASCSSYRSQESPTRKSMRIKLRGIPHTLKIFPQYGKGTSSEERNIEHLLSNSLTASRNAQLLLNPPDIEPLRYGSLMWFRLALRWQKPPHHEFSTVGREIVLETALLELTLDQIRCSMPLEFITFNDVTIVARLNAIFLFCKIAYTTIFGRITSAWQKWVVYRDISSSTIKRVAAQQIQNIALFWSSAVHLITAKKKFFQKNPLQIIATRLRKLSNCSNIASKFAEFSSVMLHF